MGRINAPLVAFNRGIISPKALARVDLDRTRLSAEVMTNWITSTQGSMTIRPGTKWFGSSLNDSGAEFVEFVASTDDVALCELTHEKMRIWLGSDAHELALLSRPKVDTTVSFSDTGWSNASMGGNTVSGSSTDLIPTMTAATTSGVTITASSQNTSQPGLEDAGPPGPISTLAFRIADDDVNTFWADTGDGGFEGGVSRLPSWLNVNFGSGNTKSVSSYSLRAGHHASLLDNMARDWRLIGSNFDTGTYATDTGKWTLEDERSNETGWAVSQRRTYSITDTGTPGPWRHWRLFTDSGNGGLALNIAEFELFAPVVLTSITQAIFSSGQLTLNAASIGALARARKRVIVSDTGTEHSLAIQVGRGPVVLRVGSTVGDDDYVSESTLGTGYHNLAFTPQGNFWVDIQSDVLINRIVSSVAIGDSGTVEVTTPWDANDLSNVRYDQSADVVFVDCEGVEPHKIERRGTGRSWSVVEYAPDDGPFLTTRSSSAKLSVSHFFGNTTLNSDIPLFKADQVGVLVRAFHDGQDGQWRLGALNAATAPVQVTGISDTGTGGNTNSERRIIIAVGGTYIGRVTIERSIDGDDIGFKTLPTSISATTSDTGTFSVTIDDPDDNLQVWYRAKITTYTSGVAVATITYGGGGVTGTARILGYNTNMAVDIEVYKRFSDTGPTDNWQLGFWSENRGFPTAVALHGGRLMHAEGGTVYLSVADDYESFDEDVEGDAGPIIRTLGAGPVDSIRYIVSLLRPIVGTAGGEITIRSSSIDEPLAPSNASASTFSTNGSANMRALRMDDKALMVQRGGQRVLMLGPSQQGGITDFQAFDLTVLAPTLLEAGVTGVAIQRQPDNRIHCVLADGRVAILTYEPQEEVVCWSVWQGDTGTGAFVEKAMVLPGLGEDAVYYHIRRTINGATKRYLEKWAMETECEGDTGLTWLMDCSRSFTDTGRATALTDVATHLVGESVVVWSDDTGSIPGVDRSPDVEGVQTRYTVDTGGDVTLSTAVHHAVVGLPYAATWKSAKLAYAAEAGTALGQMKRVAQLALILHTTHNAGLFYGDDTGTLKPLPRRIGGSGAVDPDRIYTSLDLEAVPFPGTNQTDARLVLRAKSPRPVTILGVIPSVGTSERV